MAYEFFGGKNTVVDLSKRRVFSFTTGSPEPLKKWDRRSVIAETCVSLGVGG
jgi:hypothetical protein